MRWPYNRAYVRPRAHPGCASDAASHVTRQTTHDFGAAARVGPRAVRALQRRDVPDARGVALPGVRVQDRLLRLVIAGMDVLSSHIRTDTTEYQANRERMTALVTELRERHARVREGGGPKYL